MGLASQLGDRFKTAFLSEIVGLVAGTILTVLLARVLDPDSYGLLFLAISIFTVAKLFSSFGIPKSASRYLSEYKEKDPSQIPHILRESLLMNLLVITVVVLILMSFNSRIAGIIGNNDLSEFLFFGSGFILFATLFTYVRLSLQGLEHIQTASFLDAMNKSGRALFAIGLAVLGYGALGALIGYIISYTIVSFIGILYLYFHFYSGISSSNIEDGLRHKIAKYSLPLAITQSAHSLDHQVDRILIGIFVGPAGVAFYTLGKQIVQFIETPMAALGFTLSPAYSSQRAKGNTETAARIYETAISQGLLLYIPAATGVILLAEPGITVLFGDEYQGAAPVIQILAIFVVLKSITTLTSDGLDFLGRARERAIIKGVTAVLNVLLNIVLIPIMGVVGAAIATVITYSIYTFGNVFIIHKELNINTSMMIKYSVSAVIISLMMALSILTFFDLTAEIPVLVSAVLFGATIWTVIVIPTGLIKLEQIKEAVI
ncbi:flippase [Natronorubrum aibiense]|uniref:Oligosaccharide flippase family protein n=1 Tax=Natronorubrum aibiense TaxID=348826 RepID=A0A5P9P2E0_9EURY|nr:flippase [Natronorubrum aibiense]QFU82288.1 oligosaccharide flippase family protein [Natronorubrum aibiense]